MLVVHGFTLPASLARFINRSGVQAAVYISWLPKENLDAYGNEWRTAPMEVFIGQQILSGWAPGLPNTPRLASETEEQVAERNAAAADRPGFIPWITDFSRIIQFAQNSAGEAY